MFRFHSHCHIKVAEANYEQDDQDIYCKLPLHLLLPRLTLKQISEITKAHHIKLPRKCKASDIPVLIQDHNCSTCSSHVSIFNPHVVKSSTQRTREFYNKNREARTARPQLDKERRQKDTQKTANAVRMAAIQF